MAMQIVRHNAVLLHLVMCTWERGDSAGSPQPLYSGCTDVGAANQTAEQAPLTGLHSYASQTHLNLVCGVSMVLPFAVSRDIQLKDVYLHAFKAAGSSTWGGKHWT